MIDQWIEWSTPALSERFRGVIWLQLNRTDLFLRRNALTIKTPSVSAEPSTKTAAAIIDGLIHRLYRFCRCSLVKFPSPPIIESVRCGTVDCTQETRTKTSVIVKISQQRIGILYWRAIYCRRRLNRNSASKEGRIPRITCLPLPRGSQGYWE